ncbi:hypothetical protein O3M35_010172 [Rhynocoris fuscipes]|uniref:CCHC-type domain-containing protein n=1 Tax=Rhynocoris fuscipes TaxID=488301 RepID=A0AAW1CZD9_9HEMI
MATLGDIPAIEHCISKGLLKTLKKLHLIIFGNEGEPRKIRRALRSFKGFNFDKPSKEYTKKLTDIKKYTKIADLIAICNILQLDYSGAEDELAERICTFLLNLEVEHIEEMEDEEDEDEVNKDDEDGQDEDEEDEEEDEYKRSIKAIANSMSSISIPKVRRSEKRFLNRHKSMKVDFKDVEALVRGFNGTDNFSVEKWVSEFEGVAKLLHLNDLQKLIFAQRLFTGAAKIFVQSEFFESWAELKEGLIDEFKNIYSNKELHEELSKRIKRSNESYQEYFLVMKEIANRGSIDDESLIQHIIEGIPDYESNKVILYGATSLYDLKKRIKVYEKMKKSSERISSKRKEDVSKEVRINREAYSSNKEVSLIKREEKRQEKVRCFNCGELSTHTSASCPFKSKGMKCFKCNQWGHRASECTNKKTVSYIGQKNFKVISINNHDYEALIDTGSVPNLLKINSYQKINSVPMHNTSETFSGANDAKIIPLGYITACVKIDNQEFTTNFYVVPNKTMKVDVILGDDFLKQAIVTIKPDGIKIEKHQPHVFLINAEKFHPSSLNFGDDSTVKDKAEAMIASKIPNEIKSTNGEMTIKLKDPKPVCHSSRRLSPKEKEIVENQVDQRLQDGVEESCASEYASQLVVVQKRDEGYRESIEDCKLNKITVKDEEEVKSTTSTEIIKKSEIQKEVFSSSSQVIGDKSTEFTSNELKKYCKYEGIAVHHVTKGLSRGNGQVQRLNRNIIEVPTKISIEESGKYKKKTMRTNLREVVEEEFKKSFIDSRNNIKMKSRIIILEVQYECRMTFNLRRPRKRRKIKKYEVNDLIIIFIESDLGLKKKTDVSKT